MSVVSLLILCLSLNPMTEYSTTKMPDRISALFRAVVSASSGIRREEAAIKLAQSPLAVAYYIANVAESKALSKYDRSVIDKQLDHEMLARVHRRSAWWFDKMRIDLLIETAGAISKEEERKIVVDGILNFILELDATNRAEGYLTQILFKNQTHFRWLGKDQPPGGSAFYKYGRSVEMNAKFENNKLVIAESVSIKISMLRTSIIISRGSIDFPSTSTELRSCMIFTNSALSDSKNWRVSDSLIIADGNMEIDGKTRIDKSILFVNGCVASKDQFVVNSSYIAATGPIRLPQLITGSGSFFSNGKIDVPENAHLRATPRTEPFGIRFFQLADVGVTAKLHAKGAEITALSPFSPLRLFGLRVGDVVTKVDDRTIDSPDALRRASRTAFVREAGVYYLLRNGQPLDRIVLFSDYRLP